MTSYIINHTIYCCFEWQNFFSVRFSVQLTISVKNTFLGLFFLKGKRYKGFSVTERCSRRCYECSFLNETLSQVFEILIFSLLSSGKNNLKPETLFCRRKTFFLFRASAFLQTFFLRNLLFQQVWRTWAFK